MWCISTLLFSCNATYLSFPPKYLSQNGVCSNLHFKVTMLTMGCYITNCTHCQLYFVERQKFEELLLRVHLHYVRGGEI